MRALRAGVVLLWIPFAAGALALGWLYERLGGE